jgi:UPF0716 protein FxsA
LFKILLFLFISVPLLEIYLLLKVGGYIGAMNTIALILLTAFIGTLLLRQQGLSTLARVQQTLDEGRLPAGALIEGLLLLVAGALLLTPGFFTDAIGFFCLVPPCRQWLAGHLLSRLLERQRTQARTREDPDIIEGEYWEEDERKKNNNNDYLP